MQCPICSVEGNLLENKCACCGYDMRRKSGGLRAYSPDVSAPIPQRTGSGLLARGQSLDHGRYRLVDQIALPATQRRQGTAWEAVDMQASHRLVILHEMLVPPEILRKTTADQACLLAAQQFQELGKHAGLPGVHRVFGEYNRHFIVLDYPEGVSLSSLLKRYGGSLPEEQVAAYGYQICELLTLLADARPPLVHGSISPDTIYIDENQNRASLIHLPLFKPDPPSGSTGEVLSGYYAPEQVHGELGPSADLYALAVTLHHMVTGYDPRTRLALFHPPARRLNPAVTMQMELILSRQLSLSIGQRYTHPSEMQRDLSALLEAHSEAPEQEEAGKAINPLRISSEELHERSHNMLMLNMGVFVAICVLLLIGVFLVMFR